MSDDAETAVLAGGCYWIMGHADPAFTLRTYVHLLDAGVGKGLELPGVGNVWATQDPVTAENPKVPDTAETPA